MSEDVVPLQQLQGRTIHRDAQLDQVIHYTHEQMKWWQGMHIQNQSLRRSNGEALLDNIRTVLHFGRVKAWCDILLMIFFQVSKRAQGARLKGARTIAPGA